MNIHLNFYKVIIKSAKINHKRKTYVNAANSWYVSIIRNDSMFEKLKERWIKEQKERVENSQKRVQELKGLIPIFQKFSIQRAYLFGSVSNNSCGSGSDIDLYIEILDNKLYWEILRDLESACSYDIDLYTQSDDPQFIKKIKERGIKIYESQNRNSKS